MRNILIFAIVFCFGMNAQAYTTEGFGQTIGGYSLKESVSPYGTISIHLDAFQRVPTFTCYFIDPGAYSIKPSGQSYEDWYGAATRYGFHRYAVTIFAPSGDELFKTRHRTFHPTKLVTGASKETLVFELRSMGGVHYKPLGDNYGRLVCQMGDYYGPQSVVRNTINN